MLLRATALEDADRWPEAKQALQAALALAPDQPLILNFLGYAKLERGEDLDAAEAMIRKASDARAGRCLDHRFARLGAVQTRPLDEAIETLSAPPQRTRPRPRSTSIWAMRSFRSGRRYEARFAWSAALITAEDELPRGSAKIDIGLTPGHRRALSAPTETAPAKLNLALHVRGKLPDGRHAIETIFAFCDRWRWLSGEPADDLSLQV